MKKFKEFLSKPNPNNKKNYQPNENRKETEVEQEDEQILRRKKRDMFDDVVYYYSHCIYLNGMYINYDIF